MSGPLPDVSTETPRAGESPAARSQPDSPTLAAFATLVVLVAGNVVAVRFSNQELPPFWGAGARFAVACALFFTYTRIRRLPPPRGRALVGVLLFGVLQFGLAIAFAYWALQEVPAGLASIIFASVPLFTHVFASAARLEPFHLRGMIGSAIAISGIALMFGERVGTDIPAAYLLAAVGAAASFALAPVVVKSFPEVHLATTNALAMLAGTVVLLGLSFANGESIALPEEPATWAAYLYLVLPGSIGVFGLLLFTLERWTATGVSYQAVLSPPVSIAFSAWLLNEPLTQGLFLGGALVIAGVYLGALRRNKPTPEGRENPL